MVRFEAVLTAPTPYIVGMPTERWHNIVSNIRNVATPRSYYQEHERSFTGGISPTSASTGRQSPLSLPPIDVGDSNFASPINALVVDLDNDTISFPANSALPPLPGRIKTMLLRSLKQAGVTELAAAAEQWRLERLARLDTGMEDVPLTPEDNGSTTQQFPSTPTPLNTSTSGKIPTPQRTPVPGTNTSTTSGVTTAANNRKEKQSIAMWYDVRRAFFHAIAALLVDYRDFIEPPGGVVGGMNVSGTGSELGLDGGMIRITFDAVGFVKSNSRSVRPLLSQLLETTHFSGLVFSHHVRAGRAELSRLLPDDFEPDSTFLDAWIDRALTKSRLMRPHPDNPLSPLSSIAATEAAELETVGRGRRHSVVTSGLAHAEYDYDSGSGSSTSAGITPTERPTAVVSPTEVDNSNNSDNSSIFSCCTGVVSLCQSLFTFFSVEHNSASETEDVVDITPPPQLKQLSGNNDSDAHSSVVAEVNLDHFQSPTGEGKDDNSGSVPVPVIMC